MKQRLIALVMCIIMMFTIVCTVAYAGDNSSDYTVKCTEHFINLNIMENSFWDDTESLMTRQEFAGLIYGIAKPNADFNSVVFLDVPTDSKYYKEIEYCISVGLMNGYEDSTFHPTQPISAVEAAKVLIILAGYNSNAYYNGGYPMGYSKIANRLNLYDGTGIINDEMYVTRSQVATMAFNTLICNYNSEYMIDNDGNVGYTVSDETVSQHYLNYKYINGIMQSNGIIDVDDVNAGTGNIIIDGQSFKINNDTFMDYIGHKVECFYDNNSKTAESVVTDIYDTKTLVIRQKNIKNALDGRIEYYEGDAERSARIKNDALYFLNGTPQLDFDIEEIKLMPNAEVYLISNDGSENYGLVFVNVYTDIIVGNKGTDGKIIDIFNPSTSAILDEYGQKPLRIVDFKNNEIAYNDISRENIVSVMEETNFIYAKVSNQCLNGILESKYDDVIKVNGEEYIIAESYRTAAKGLAIGGNVKLYLNFNNEVIKAINNGGEVSQYGYLYNCVLDKALSSKLYFQIYTTGGEMIDLYADDKIKIDDKTITVNKLTSIPSELLSNEGSIKKCLIGFTVDDKGKIGKIDLPADSFDNGESTFLRKVSMGKLGYTYTNGIFDGQHIIDANTVLMQVPDESNDEELFDVFEKSALITKDYTVDIYYNSSISEFADVVVFYGPSQNITYDSTIAVLSSIVQTFDENGEIVKAAEYFSNGSLMTAYIPESLEDEFAVMEKGDTFRFAINKDMNFTEVKWIFDMNKNTQINAYGATDYGASARVLAKYAANVGSSTIRLSDTKILGVSDSSIYDFEVIIPKTVQYIVVEGDDAKIIRAGQLSDISPGDRVVTYQRSTTPRCMIIYKDLD